MISFLSLRLLLGTLFFVNSLSFNESDSDSDLDSINGNETSSASSSSIISNTSDCTSYTLVSGDYCDLLSSRFGVDVANIFDVSDGNKPCLTARMWVGDVMSICGSGGGGGGGGSISGLISEATYNSLFPSKDARYSYANFVKSGTAYPTFVSGTDPNNNKRELAAFLANAGHETGDFVYACEICGGPACGQCPDNYNYGGDSAHQYYGRGALQLSWNYNYQSAGTALGVDLMSNPNVVVQTELIFSTSLWFWMQGCHETMQNNNGFGNTIKMINGGIECGQSSGVGYTEMLDRVNRYQKLCSLFGVDPGSGLTC